MGRQAVGDAVDDGETIVEISTDKVDMELPAPAAGTITEILADEGETVTVGQVIARMTTAGARRRRSAAAPAAAGADAPTAAPRRRPDAPTDANASPVAARVAAAEGVDLAASPAPARAGRITKADVLDARQRRRAPPRRRRASATPLKGGAAMLARYMDESRSIPTATSFRTITVTAMDGRRKQLKDAGQKVSFTHLIAYAIALAVAAGHAGDGPPLRARSTASRTASTTARSTSASPSTSRRRTARRTLMVPVIRDAGRLSFADFKAAFDDLIDKARDEHAHRRRPHRREHLAHQPGRHRHGRLGPAADGRPGHDRRHRLDRLPGRPRRTSATMIGAEKVMTMTSTYDHRIIQGAESGRFLQTRRGLPAGRERLLRGRLRRRSASSSARRRRRRRPPPPRPPPRAAPRRRAAGAVDEELLQAVQAATSLLKAHRTHGHLAARLDPLGTEPEGDPALDPEPLGLTPELMAPDPGADPAHVRAGRDARRRAAAPARDLLRHDRLRDRAHRQPPPARVAAREDRVRRLPQAADDRRAAARCCSA